MPRRRSRRTQVEVKKPVKPVYAFPAGYSDLETAVTVALLHPEQWHIPVTDYLRAVLAECGEHPQPEAIENLLRAERGTELEPFVLRETDYALAGLLGAMAFSSRVGETRFRVVSRDTIGDRGGFIITNNLRGYFAQRYAGGVRRPQEQFSGALFAPTLAEAGRREPLSGTLGFDETDAMKLTLNWAQRRRLPDGLEVTRLVGRAEKHPDPKGSLSSLLQYHSTVIGGNPDGFDRLGFRITVNPSRGKRTPISLAPGSSEAILRFMALCTQRTTVRLGVSPPEDEPLRDQGGDLRAVYARMTMPDADSITVPLLPVYQSAMPSLWLRFPALFADAPPPFHSVNLETQCPGLTAFAAAHLAIPPGQHSRALQVIEAIAPSGAS